MTKEEIMEAIENMTVLELADLVKAMEGFFTFFSGVYLLRSELRGSELT
jgi:ribosomal protein L7/L12